MDIYILRDGEQIGPFSEETTYQMLKQGVVLGNDSAWRPGMPEWIPLQNLLHPANEDVTVSTLEEESAPSIPPVDQSPEPAPAQTKKEERPQRFFELCQTEAAEALSGVTKPHCQVLVGYLDAKFPNWDAGKEKDTAWNYFFPAVAEKFPQLVRAGWKEKLQYPKGSQKSAPEPKRQATTPVRPSSTKAKASSPAASFFKGFVLGSLIVAVSVGGIYVYKHPAVLDKAKAQLTGLAAKPSKTEDAGSKETSLNPGTEPQKTQTLSSNMPGTEKQTQPTASTAANSAGGNSAPTAPAAPSMSGTNQPDTGMNTVPDPALPEPSSTPSSNGMALFDPSAGSQTPANGTAGGPNAGSGMPAAKTSVTLMQPLELQLSFGKIKIPAGTQLPIVEQNGANVKVRFQNQVVSVPANITDLGEGGLPQ